MIHPTAIVDPGAYIAEGVEVGPYSIIGNDVEIKKGTVIGPHVVIKGPTKIGEDNKILQFSSIGEDPQDKKYAGESTLLEIGERNLIRENCTINRGTVQGGGITKIGSDNWIMAYVHIAHDCIIGNSTVIANGTTFAGHVTIQDFVILGGFTLVHQFVVLGKNSFTAINTIVLKDIPPYVMVSGRPAEPHGLNTEGLKRNGFEPEVIKEIQQAYKVLYKSNTLFKDAKAMIKEMAENCEPLKDFSEFLENSQRGVVR
ncbi:MAG TPA: acyl-ACP--UDP-N-acetylglucosamine O-acyltransferase [Gammaproteobacteria bacterium]|nr:acyl-ACP--UDP-N-acetylglucosamine O-acyltransferase [Gammaproteobacteria bacterium]